MWWPRIALTLSILAAALLVFSGLGVRAGLWPFRVGFGMFAGAMLAGMAAIGAASIALAVPRLRRPKPTLIAALLLGAASAAMPLEHLRRVKTLPYINDITTDTEQPPQFLQAKPYESHFAELQQLGYPGLRPLELAAPPAQAFARALAAAHAMGLEVRCADQNAGPHRSGGDYALVRLPGRRGGAHRAGRRGQPHRRALEVASRPKRRRSERSAHSRIPYTGRV